MLFRSYGVKNARVGVLSIGEEEDKGNELTAQTLELLRQTNLNVVGNVEGHDIYSGDVDIVVCDGFTGNIVLKTSEGVAQAIKRILREEIYRSLRTQIGYKMMKPALEGLQRRIDWRHVGGCFLVGVDGVCIIGHGRSDRLAVQNALAQAARSIEAGIIARMREHFRSSLAGEVAVAS